MYEILHPMYLHYVSAMHIAVQVHKLIDDDKSRPPWHLLICAEILFATLVRTAPQNLDIDARIQGIIQDTARFI